MPVLVSQWTLLTGISGVCKKAIEALCAINASPFMIKIYDFLDQISIVTLLQYGWMLRPFLARDSIQSLQLFNAKSQPRP